MERNNDAAAVGGTVAGLGALAIVLIVAAVVAGIIVALLAAGGIGIFAVKQTLFQVESSVTLEGMEMVSVFICLVFKPLSLSLSLFLSLARARKVSSFSLLCSSILFFTLRSPLAASFFTILFFTILFFILHSSALIYSFLPRCVLRRPSLVCPGQPLAKRPPSAMVLTPEQVAQMGLTPAGSTSEILPSYADAAIGV